MTSNSEPTPTPLSEVDPQSLDTLFSKDPLDLTDTDVAQIILVMREKRKTWAKEENEAKSAGRKPKARSKGLSKAAAAKIDLNDIEI